MFLQGDLGCVPSTHIKWLKALCIFNSRDPTCSLESFRSEILNKALWATSLSRVQGDHSCFLSFRICLDSSSYDPLLCFQSTNPPIHCCFHICSDFLPGDLDISTTLTYSVKSFLSCDATYTGFKYQDFTSFGVRHYARYYNQIFVHNSWLKFICSHCFILLTYHEIIKCQSF